MFSSSRKRCVSKTKKTMKSCWGARGISLQICIKVFLGVLAAVGIAMFHRNLPENTWSKLGESHEGLPMVRRINHGNLGAIIWQALEWKESALIISPAPISFRFLWFALAFWSWLLGFPYFRQINIRWFPSLKTEKFGGFTKFPFHVFW